jgi:hypothetical protein
VTARPGDPVALSAEEFGAIEHGELSDVEPRPLDRHRAVSVELTMPALHPSLSIPIRADHPLVASAAARAAHLRLDDQAHADIYVATLTRAEAAELLDDPARRVNDTGEAELAKRVLGEDDAALRFTVPRAELPLPAPHPA